MARVPITVMGYRCERCSHEWVPRGLTEEEPRVCPKCRSPWWNRPKRSMMVYEDFSAKIVATLRDSEKPLTWTEIRTKAGLPQLFPNNQWVHRLERDIGLKRRRQADGVIFWELSLADDAKPPAETADKLPARKSRKQGAVE